MKLINRMVKTVAGGSKELVMTMDIMGTEVFQEEIHPFRTMNLCHGLMLAYLSISGGVMEIKGQTSK